MRTALQVFEFVFFSKIDSDFFEKKFFFFFYDIILFIIRFFPLFFFPAKWILLHFFPCAPCTEKKCRGKKSAPHHTILLMWMWTKSFLNKRNDELYKVNLVIAQ